MSNQTVTTATQPEKELFIKMVIMAWETYNTRTNKLLDELSDDDLLKEVAPGRNRGIYLLGHLTAVADGMLPILGLGEKLYPELENIFLTNPDKAGIAMPAVHELRQYWKEVNIRLLQQMAALPAAEWFSRHTAVSEEDFIKEPHRNKLNIIINRTNHLSNHLGQLVFLKNKK